MSEGDVSYWKEKYRLMEEQYGQQKRRNEELEDRLLDMVDKVETDKMTLSLEIDNLTRKLETSEDAVRRFHATGAILPPTDGPLYQANNLSEEPEDPVIVDRAYGRVMLTGPSPSQSGYHHFPVLAMDEGFIYGFRWQKGAVVKVV